MTKRQAFLAALRCEPVDRLVWAPNIDYWFNVNWAEGTLPPKYDGASRFDILRDIGAHIWARSSATKIVRDPSVVERKYQVGNSRVHEFETPIGTIREVYLRTEGDHRAMYRAERFIKDLDCISVMKYVLEATHYEPDYEPTLNTLAEVGDDGIVVNQCFCVPFVQFAKSDAGYINGFYMWMDHRHEVESLLEAYTRLFLQGYEVLADGPADVISTGDNMDGVMISPALFREYAVPFYREAKNILEPKGKIFEAHWCGRTQNLLEYVPGCGLDVVEAVVTRPMANISLSDALDLLNGEVALQGGLPSVMVCHEGGTWHDFERYIENEILPQAERPGFVLGMADNVPPNADFARVQAVSKMIAKSGTVLSVRVTDEKPQDVLYDEIDSRRILIRDTSSDVANESLRSVGDNREE